MTMVILQAGTKALVQWTMGPEGRKKLDLFAKKREARYYYNIGQSTKKPNSFITSLWIWSCSPDDVTGGCFMRNLCPASW
jgi:hypothetical protein